MAESKVEGSSEPEGAGRKKREFTRSQRAILPDYAAKSTFMRKFLAAFDSLEDTELQLQVLSELETSVIPKLRKTHENQECEPKDE